MSKKDSSLKPGDNLQKGNLFPFDAHYKFDEKTYSTTIWAKDFASANELCAKAGLTNEGQIVGVYSD